MIQLIDSMLEAHLRAEVPLPVGVDVAFNTPDKRWGATVTAPTVNCFLWDIRRSEDRAEAGRRLVRRSDGTTAAARLDPTIRFRYLVTAWASEHRDEHQLLGSVLRCVLAHDTVPAAHVPAPLGEVGPVEVTLAGGEPRPNDFWSSLDGQLKPGLEVVLTMLVPLGLEDALGPPITEFGTTVERKPVSEEAAPARAARPIHGVARERVRRGRTIITTAVERGPTETADASEPS